jgi:hypothetical protein
MQAPGLPTLVILAGHSNVKQCFSGEVDMRPKEAIYATKKRGSAQQVIKWTEMSPEKH